MNRRRKAFAFSTAAVGAAGIMAAFLTSPVAALRGERYDLASLIFESHAVILAERGPQRPLKNWAAATPYTVKKVYRGSMLPGQKIEVFEHTRPDPAEGLPLDNFGSDEKPTVVDRDSFVIVRKWNPLTSGMQSWLPKDTPTLTLAAERFVLKDRVYSLEDGFLRPQDRGTEDADRNWPVEALTMEEFEAELRKAISKVEKFNAAIKIQDPVSRRDAILALIEPREEPAMGEAPLSHEGYADRLRQTAMELFTEWGDRESALEVAARSAEGLGFHFHSSISDQDLLREAGREDAPAHRRAAALYLIARHYPTGGNDLLGAVQRLLICKEPQVKRAAAHLLARAAAIQWMNPQYHKPEDSAPLVAALLTAWRQERDPAFRIAILRASQGNFFPGVLAEEDKKPDLLFTGRIRAGRAHFTAESVTRHDWQLEGLVVVAVLLNGKEEHRSRETSELDMRAIRSWSNSRGVQGGSFPVRFEPPLSPGRYRMQVEACIKRSENGKVSNTVVQAAPQEVEIAR